MNQTQVKSFVASIVCALSLADGRLLDKDAEMVLRIVGRVICRRRGATCGPVS